mgnify:CR=1 FL=1
MTCRICLDDGDMIQPCNCTGTTAYVHEECLMKWLTISERRDCEICKFEYEIIEVEEERKVDCTVNVFSNNSDATAVVLAIGLLGHFTIMLLTTYWGTSTYSIFIYGNLLQAIMLILLQPHVKIREVYFFWKCCSLVCLVLSSTVTENWNFVYCELLFTVMLGINICTRPDIHENQTVQYINITDRSSNDETVQGP